MRPSSAELARALRAPFDWRAVALWRAARVGAGVVVPLALGWVSGDVRYGAFAALGALPAGFASFQGASRSRLAAVVAASIGMAVSTFAGATTATMPWLVMLAVVMYGYLIGVMVCLGPRVSVVALQWAVGFGIAAGLPLPPAQAAMRAGLVLAGGLFQGLLVASTWTFRPGDSERATLAASYRALAQYASGLTAGPLEAPASTAFPALTAVADPNPLLPVGVRLMLVDLLEEAERIRASLAALAAEISTSPMQDRRAGRDLCAGAADALSRIAAALDAPRRERAGRITDLGRRVAELTVAPDVAWRWAAEAILGELRAVVDILQRVTAVPTRADSVAHAAIAPPRSDDGVATMIVTLRANLTPATEAGRHALRLAIVAGLAELLGQATGLPEGRWVVLTIFLVLKPDYASTLSRSAHRAVGTALGAGIAAVAAHLSGSAQGALVAVAGVSIAVAYAMFDASYLVFSVFLTSFIVVLLDLLGFPALATAEARLIDTAIGAALALLAFLAWPTWEGLSAPAKFARLLERHRDYACTLLRQIARPRELDPAGLRGLQRAARAARSDAEASTVRLIGERPHPPLTHEVAGAFIAAVRRLAHAELALHALVAARSSHDAEDERVSRRLDAFAAALATTLSRLAASLRALEPVPPVPALRPVHSALLEAPVVDAVVVGVTDRLVDAVNTIDAIVRDHFGTRHHDDDAARVMDAGGEGSKERGPGNP